MNTESMTASAANVCPQCGAQFRCGMEAGDKECWCASLPALLPLPKAGDPGAAQASCLCPDCLKARLEAAGALPQRLAG